MHGAMSLQSLVKTLINTGQELLDIPEDWWKEHKVMRAHWEVTRASFEFSAIAREIARKHLGGT